jgi:pre-mRNA-splicing factor RBM22/SLT11
VNDPIANKILSKITDSTKVPEAPADKEITTLFVGGITSQMTEADLHEKMGPFGKILKVDLLPKQNCGFVRFNLRENAEKAIQTLHDKLFIGEA